MGLIISSPKQRRRAAKAYAAARDGERARLERYLSVKGVPSDSGSSVGAEEIAALGDIAAVRDKSEWSLLMIAAMRGRIPCVELLIAAGADVNLTSEEGLSAIHLAALSGELDACKLLLDAKALIDQKEYLRRQTPLMLAARCNHTHVAKLLLSHKASVRSEDCDGQSALIWALNGPLALIDSVLEAKADVTKKNNFGQEPLHYAANRSYAAQSVVDLKEGVGGGTGGVSSAQSAPSDVMSRLLAAKAEVNAKNYDDYTALMIACYQGLFGAAKLLIGAKASLNARARQGQNSLMVATAAGKLPLLELLARSGADLNLSDEIGQTAMVKAVLLNRPAELRALLTAKADCNARDADGLSALAHAAEKGRTFAVLAILKFGSGVKVNLADSRHRTPLLLAARRNDVRATRALLERKASIESVDADGNTCVLNALHDRRPLETQMETVKILLESKASANQPSHAGHTPLLCAAERTLGGVVKILVSSGADVNVTHPTQRCTALSVWQSRVKVYGSPPDAAEIEDLLTPRRNGSLADEKRSKERASSGGAPEDGSSVGTAQPTPPGVKLNPLDWDAERVGKWLGESTGLWQYVDAFKQEQINGDMLLNLLNEDAAGLLQRELGVSKELHRIKIIRALRKLERACSGSGLTIVGSASRGGGSSRDGGGDGGSDGASSRADDMKVHTIPYRELTFEREIAQGAFGRVFLGRWRNSPVAIKQLHEQQMTRGRLEELLREAQILERVANHPRVVRFLGVCCSPGDPLCFATEFLSAGSVE